MKKIQAALKKEISVGALVLIFVGCFPLTGLCQTVYVKDHTTNIRSGNGLEHTIVAVVKMDQALRIVEEKEKWLKVMIPSGKEGWISRRTTTSQKPASVIILELKKTLDIQLKEIAELKATEKTTSSKKEILSSELKEITVNHDLLLMENEKLKKSKEILWISGVVIAAAFTWLTGFFAGHLRIGKENKRFKKMNANAMALNLTPQAI